MKRMLCAAATVLSIGSMIAPPVIAAPEASVTPLRSEALPDYPGKEAQMIVVDYPPGAVDPVHRHDAHAFVYVLEEALSWPSRAARR